MRRILGNKIGFGITALIFALGLGCNALLGVGMVMPSHAYGVTLPSEIDSTQGPVLHRASGPILPPDPWTPSSGARLTASGPILPPDPWTPSSGARLTASGPILPPDPWTPSSGAIA